MDRVEAGGIAGDVVHVHAPLAVLAQRPRACGDLLIVRHDRAGISERAEVLGGIEAERSGEPARTGSASVTARTVRLAGVFDDRESVTLGRSPERDQVGHLTVEMDGQDEPRSRSHRVLGGGWIEGVVPLADVHQYRLPACLWLGGSFRDRLRVYVDGRPLADLRYYVNGGGHYTSLGSALLSRGAHSVILRLSGPDLHPGSGGYPFGMGPIVLSHEPDDLSIESVVPDRATTLCNRRLDWVDAFGPPMPQ
jgi:hypothetical protein